MCETYEAIYEMKKISDDKKLTVWTDLGVVTGHLAQCDCGCDGKCLKNIITIKDADIFCFKTKKEKHLNWINISSKWIRMFMFHDEEM